MGCWASALTVERSKITNLATGGMLVVMPCRMRGLHADAGDGRRLDLHPREKFVTLYSSYVKGLRPSRNKPTLAILSKFSQI